MLWVLLLQGYFFTALVNFGYISDFQTVCENAVNVRIQRLSKQKIREKLKERYTTSIKQNVKEALEKMKVELGEFTKVQKQKETEYTIITSKMQTLLSLDDMVSRCRKRLQKIKEMCAYPTKDK